MLKNFGTFKRSMSTDGQHAIIRVLDAIDVVFNKDFVILEVNNFLWAYYMLFLKMIL